MGDERWRRGPTARAIMDGVAGDLMITRVWRGWTTSDNADAYERFLMDGLFPSMRSIPGFDGAVVLRRAEGDEVGFITLTRFESIDAIRAFAGDDYETAVLEPRALELLSRYDERAAHYETASF
jgi:antibiotic biosynthesis monooxygenase (ABM) superfamily enzyme